MTIDFIVFRLACIMIVLSIDCMNNQDYGSLDFYIESVHASPLRA